MKSVDVVASGYDWVCPDCNHENHEIGLDEHFTCPNCKKMFEIGNIGDAY